MTTSAVVGGNRPEKTSWSASELDRIIAGERRDAAVEAFRAARRAICPACCRDEFAEEHHLIHELSCAMISRAMFAHREAGHLLVL